MRFSVKEAYKKMQTCRNELTCICMANLLVIGCMILMLKDIKWPLLIWGIQVFSLVSFYLYEKHLEGQESNANLPLTAEIFKLEHYEKEHEQKRHVQVAMALVELGRRNEAVSYIESVMNDIA